MIKLNGVLLSKNHESKFLIYLDELERSDVVDVDIVDGDDYIIKTKQKFYR